MKYVHVHGGSKSQRRLVDSAIHWYIKKYLPKVRNLDIDVQIKKIDRDTNGLCAQISDREFDIELNSKISKAELVAVTMHEMIHVKQYIRNEICEMPTGSVRWKSRVMNPNNIDYWDHPWEKEAHKYDEAYAYDFMVETGRW
jgi:hypothetical protein